MPKSVTSTAETKFDRLAEICLELHGGSLSMMGADIWRRRSRRGISSTLLVRLRDDIRDVEEMERHGLHHVVVADNADVPRPGSLAARDRGCACSMKENRMGKGFHVFGDEAWWVNRACPLHRVQR